MKKINLLWILFLTMLILYGCSGSGVNPVLPGDLSKMPEMDSLAFPAIHVADVDPDGNPIGGVGTLGLFYGKVNPMTLEASLTPLRESTSALPDSVVVDITNFLSIYPCYNCVDLKSISLDDQQNPVLSIGIKHPFAAGNPSLPASPTNRLDLHVFSARGFIVSDGLVGGGAMSFPVLKQDVPAWRLINASGYSSEFDTEWDKVLDTASTLHPYILHFDDYSMGNFSKTADNGFINVSTPTGNTVMPMGSDFDYKDYVIQVIPDPVATFEFIYAVTVSYGLSAKGKSEWLNPKYRVPQYCQKPATMVRLGEIDNKLDDVNATSYADLTVEILDINHGVPTGTEIDQMDIDSSIKTISVEIPDLSAEVFSIDAPSAYVSGSATDQTDPWKAKIRITNTKVAGLGKHIGIIKVLDAYTSDANKNLPGNAIPRVGIKDKPGDFIFKINEWATYTVFEIMINLGNKIPTCELKLGKDSILGGATVTAEPGPGTADPDGSIIFYEYDHDYDGQVFDVDASNSSGSPVTLGPYPNDTGGDIVVTVAMRVTDDGDPAQSKICTKDLTIEFFSAVILFDDFNDNANGWTFDNENYWGIKNGFLASSGGTQSSGTGCYNDDTGSASRYGTSKTLDIPPLPEGYSNVKLTIFHAVDTEIFPLNPFEFTDDCDVWIKPDGMPAFKLLTTDGVGYNTSLLTSKDGPSFAGDTIGTDPAFGNTFVGVESIFVDSAIAGGKFKIQFRQQADDGINNCLGGWWIDWIKLEFAP